MFARQALTAIWVKLAVWQALGSLLIHDKYEVSVQMFVFTGIRHTGKGEKGEILSEDLVVFCFTESCFSLIIAPLGQSLIDYPQEIFVLFQHL